MKRHIFSLLTALVASVSMAGAQGTHKIIPFSRQNFTVLDSAEYKFTFKLHFLRDVKKGERFENDLIVLASKDFVKTESIWPEPEQNPDKMRAGEKIWTEGRGLGGTEVFKNLKEGKETVTVKLTTPSQPFIYEEALSKQTWKISREKRKILGYTCQKATTSFLGRNYTAWFTKDIPVQNGPWKFGGLPGMILNVSDSEQHYVFECTGAQRLKEKVPIVKYNYYKKYEKTTREELNKLIKWMHNDGYAYVIYHSPQLEGQLDSTASNRKTPYNPIERE